MSKKGNPALIGGFVIGGIVLLIVGITTLGSGRFFRETYPYVLYFDSDVSGLSEGANVKLKGVVVGEVKDVLLGIGNLSQLTSSDERFYVPVVIELDADKTASLGARSKPDPETVARLVARGLRGQLASESFVTGVLYVKLDLFPDTRPRLIGASADAPYPEIPTLPTPLEEVQMKALEFVAELREVDVSGLVDELKAAVVATRELIEAPGLREAVDHLDTTLMGMDEALASVTATSESVRAVVEPLQSELETTMAELRSTLAEIRQTSTKVGSVLRSDSPVVVALERALVDAAKTTAAVRELAAMLERNPDALLRGRGETEGER